MNKKLLVTAITGLLTLPGVASATSVGGIELGAAGFTFLFTDVFEQKVGGGPITATGDVLSGYGEVSAIRDNSGATVWSRGGIGGADEITLQFQFTAGLVTPTHVDFTGGFVNFYVDTTPDFNPQATNVGNSGSGLADGNGTGATEWLNLQAVSQDFGGSHVPDAALHSTGTLLGAPVLAGSGVGLFNVAAGAGVANSYFNTNTFAYTSSTGGGLADFDFNSSFTNTGSAVYELSFNGTSNFRGYTTVPEPTSLVLIGLGLLGFRVTALRKKS